MSMASLQTVTPLTLLWNLAMTKLTTKYIILEHEIHFLVIFNPCSLNWFWRCQNVEIFGESDSFSKVIVDVCYCVKTFPLYNQPKPPAFTCMLTFIDQLFISFDSPHLAAMFPDNGSSTFFHTELSWLHLWLINIQKYGIDCINTISWLLPDRSHQTYYVLMILIQLKDTK